MTKVIFVVHKRPDMSWDEFRRYWRGGPGAGDFGVALRPLPVDPLGHHDLPGLRFRLQPGGGVHDVADGREVLHLAGPDVAHERQAEVHAYAQRQPWPLSGAESHSSPQAF